MRRTGSFVVAWVIAAVVAGGIAWQGVAVVGDQVTTPRPAALDQADVEARLASPPGADTAARPDSGTSTSTTDPGGDDEDSPDEPTTSAQPTPGGSPVTTKPQPRSPATNPPSAPSPSTTATTVAPASEVRTYNLVGGTAALRFSPSGVTVEYATPKAGFTVEVEPENVNGVKVEFESADHKSRVDGWWDNGPRDRVREDSESDSGSDED